MRIFDGERFDRIKGFRWRLSDALRNKVWEQQEPCTLPCCLSRLQFQVDRDEAICAATGLCPRCGKDSCIVTPRPWGNQCTLVRDQWALENAAALAGR